MKRHLTLFLLFIGGLLFCDAMSDIENNFNADRISKTIYLLDKFNPQTNEEKAFKLYYQYKTSLDEITCCEYLDEIIVKFPKTKFGLKAKIQKSKLFFAKKEFENALSLLNENGSIEELKLISDIYFEQKKYDESKRILNKLLSKTNSSDECEIILMKIVKCDIEKKEYHSALKSLNALKESVYINNLIPEFLYYSGICYKKLDDKVQAKKFFVKLVSEYPYNDYTPKAKQEIAKLSEFNASHQKTNLEKNAKKSGNLYLQVGAFSQKTNAKKRLDDMVRLGLDASIWNNGGKFKVVIGPFSSREKILDVKQNLKKQNINSFVIKK